MSFDTNKKRRTHGSVTGENKYQSQWKSEKLLPFILNFDSPVIYGVRVETSNPYHLLYIENILFSASLIGNTFSISTASKKVKTGF